MKIYSTLFTGIVSVGLLALVACNSNSGEVIITQTREVTNRDKNPQLFASSEDQFLSPQAKQAFAPTQTTKDEAAVDHHPSGIHADYIGADWQAIAGTQFRVLNYKLPTGEIYVSISGGGLVPNINRWLRQFQAEAIAESGLDKLKQAPLGNNLTAYIVEASGAYAPGMGRPNKDNQALLSAIAPYPQGGSDQFISIKLIADAPLSDTLTKDFYTFIDKLHWNE